MDEKIKAKLKNKIDVMKAALERGEPITPEMKIDVLVLGDSPTVSTGFGNVCKEVLELLYETQFYNFEIVGINYDGSPHSLPYRIHPAINALLALPAYRDVYGRQKFLDLASEGRFDLLWIIQDTFIIENMDFGKKIAECNRQLPAEDKFAFIFYFPIDATPRKSWIDNSVLFCEHPVAYTRYAYDEILKLYDIDENSLLPALEQERNKKLKAELSGSMNVIYHGVNTKNFYPLEIERQKELRGILWGEAHKDKFVFINLNRNQPRKDMFRTLLAFKKLLDKRRAMGKNDVYLYTHCSVVDGGLNMIDMADQIGLVQGDEFAFPDARQFNVSKGFPIHIVNEMYNAADCLVTTTLGEGWGLSLTEAMAVKIPVIAPDNTSIPEILGKTDGGTGERGLIVKTNNCFVQNDDNSRIRPLTDVDDLVEKMNFVVENRAVLQPMVERAYSWVKELEWSGDIVGGKWKALFEQAYIGNISVRALALDKKFAEVLREAKIGRNDECPICKPIKYKNCRHYDQ